MASIAVGLLLLVPPLLRAPVIVLAAAAVAVVGVSTLVTGWHRMADRDQRRDGKPLPALEKSDRDDQDRPDCQG